VLLWRACLLTRSRTVSATDSPIGLESSIAAGSITRSREDPWASLPRCRRSDPRRDSHRLAHDPHRVSYHELSAGEIEGTVEAIIDDVEHAAHAIADVEICLVLHSVPEHGQVIGVLLQRVYKIRDMACVYLGPSRPANLNRHACIPVSSWKALIRCSPAILLAP